jgi:hypothetical protein
MMMLMVKRMMFFVPFILVDFGHFLMQQGPKQSGPHVSVALWSNFLPCPPGSACLRRKQAQ